MRYSIVWISLILIPFWNYAQNESEEISFNEQTEHRVGVGFTITGFNSNFTYFVSPHYSFRYHRHWFGFTPFYGRLEPIAQQQDIGVGIDYRFYPFKNESGTLLYFPVGAHYNYKWTDRSERSAVIYKVGFGVDALIGKNFAISIDANFGVGQTLSSEIQQAENSTFGSPDKINFYFLPTIRISYGL